MPRAELFRDCSASEISALASTAYSMTFETGDLLCEEGAESLECYVIGEGEAEVIVAGKVVRRVEVNDIVGERGPLTGHARSATVRATSHMHTFAISRERLRDLAERSPRARAGMFAYMKDRYSDQVGARSGTGLDDLPSFEARSQARVIYQVNRAWMQERSASSW